MHYGYIIGGDRVGIILAMAERNKAVAIVALQSIEGGHPDIALIILRNGRHLVGGQSTGNGKMVERKLARLLAIAGKRQHPYQQQKENNSYQSSYNYIYQI